MPLLSSLALHWTPISLYLPQLGEVGKAPDLAPLMVLSRSVVSDSLRPSGLYSPPVSSVGFSG